MSGGLCDVADKLKQSMAEKAKAVAGIDRETRQKEHRQEER